MRSVTDLLRTLQLSTSNVLHETVLDLHSSRRLWNLCQKSRQTLTANISNGAEFYYAEHIPGAQWTGWSNRHPDITLTEHEVSHLEIKATVGGVWCGTKPTEGWHVLIHYNLNEATEELSFFVGCVNLVSSNWHKRGDRSYILRKNIAFKLPSFYCIHGDVEEKGSTQYTLKHVSLKVER